MDVLHRVQVVNSLVVLQVRRLQDAAQQQQREKMQLQAERKQERKLQETELNNCKEKVLKTPPSLIYMIT